MFANKMKMDQQLFSESKEVVLLNARKTSDQVFKQTIKFAPTLKRLSVN